jgi:hypothetical protein
MASYVFELEKNKNYKVKYKNKIELKKLVMRGQILMRRLDLNEENFYDAYVQCMDMIEWSKCSVFQIPKTKAVKVVIPGSSKQIMFIEKDTEVENKMFIKLNTETIKKQLKSQLVVAEVNALESYMNDLNMNVSYKVFYNAVEVSFLSYYTKLVFLYNIKKNAVVMTSLFLKNRSDITVFEETPTVIDNLEETLVTFFNHNPRIDDKLKFCETLGIVKEALYNIGKEQWNNLNDYEQDLLALEPNGLKKTRIQELPYTERMKIASKFGKISQAWKDKELNIMLYEMKLKKVEAVILIVHEQHPVIYDEKPSKKKRDENLKTKLERYYKMSAKINGGA